MRSAEFRLRTFLGIFSLALFWLPSIASGETFFRVSQDSLRGHAFVTAPPGSTRFLRLEGRLAPGQSAEELIAKFDSAFYAPLHDTGIGLISSITQVSGDRFYANFVTEPKNLAMVSAFNDFVSKKEASDFQGARVEFRKVARLHEEASLLAGVYDSHQEDDPFVQNFALKRTFDFQSLAEWIRFTDTYGEAMMTKDHQKFLNYLETFVQDSKDFAAVLDALRRDDMVAIDPQVSIVLDDQSVFGPDFEHTAFVPFRFFRNCFDQGFEKGVCAGSQGGSPRL